MNQAKHKYLKYKQKYLDLKKLLGGAGDINYEYVSILYKDYYGLNDFRPFNRRIDPIYELLYNPDDSDDVRELDRQLSRAPTIMIEDHIEECYFYILAFHTTIESAEGQLLFDDIYMTDKYHIIGKIIYPENYTIADLIDDTRGYWLTVSSDNLAEEIDGEFITYKLINIKFHLNKDQAIAEAIVSNGTIKMHKDKITYLHMLSKYNNDFKYQ